MHTRTDLKSTIGSWDWRISCVKPGDHQIRFKLSENKNHDSVPAPPKMPSETYFGAHFSRNMENHEREVATEMMEVEKKKLVKL